MEETSAKLFCCQWVRRRVPLAYREELYHILKMMGPLLMARILHYLLPVVITIFCGRLGNEVLAGYGIASATINISTTATGLGLALASDTLISQMEVIAVNVSVCSNFILAMQSFLGGKTFGGRNMLRVGVILQRSVLILLLFCLPCWGLLINSQAILLALGQDPEVARIAQLYVIAFMPAVPAMFLKQLMASYLQNQGIILPQMYTAVLAMIATVVTNYVLIFWMDLGVKGSAAANALSMFYLCGFLFAYMWWKKLHVKTWGGWSVESLQEWGSYMQLAIPSTMMICFEWWIYEVGGFLAGMLSDVDLAAQHIVVVIAYINYMFPFSVQAAVCVRVGNALGAGDTAGAVLTSKTAIAFTGGMVIIQGLVLGSTKTVIAYIFTSDEQIIDLVSHLMNGYCFIQIFDGFVCTCSGIILGTGRQKIAAIANLIGYYCIGLPLCITLMFVAKLRGLGFWLGLLVAVCCQATFYIIVILFKFDWERMTQEAVKRAKDSTQGHTEAVDGDATDHITSVNGYTSVSAEGQEGPSGTGAGEAPRTPLSTTQLVIRRGLTALAAVVVLAVGTSVHLLLPLPQTLPTGNLTMDWINATHPPVPVQSTLLT